MPLISFSCGHAFHNLCFYSHFSLGENKFFCLKCKDKKNKVYNNKNNHLMINRSLNNNHSEKILLKNDMNYLDIISKQRND